MPLQNRNTLKSFFRKGHIPTENHFVDVIDSFVNKVDDGMSKTLDDGLMLSPIGASKKLMSFFKSIEEKSAAWSLDIDSGNATLSFNNHVGESVLALTNEGNVGIRNARPKYELDVDGTVGMKGRIGTFQQGKVLGDGQWHPILTGLNGCHILEVVAGIGKKKTGKYGMIHAIAMSTFGKSENSINISKAYYGVRCNQIQLRWTGTTYNYNLEMRSRCDYGGDFYITYAISKLWFDEFMDNCVGAE
jgi:hypothetical protein